MRNFTGLLLLIFSVSVTAQPINRKALVERHTVVNKSFDSLSSLSVGNGKFAFTVDATGLQSFPEYYHNGINLGTESEWGWHSFTDTAGYQFDETLKEYELNGRKVSYSVQINEPPRKKNAVNWFRQNVHRLQLGNIGFELMRSDGTMAALQDIKDISQTLNMWTGEIHSSFTLEKIPVEVITICDQQNDIIAVDVRSALVKQGRIKIRIRFPFPTNNFLDGGDNWQQDEKHLSSYSQPSISTSIFRHQIDSMEYSISLQCNGYTSVLKKQEHYFLISPPSGKSNFSFTAFFAKGKMWKETTAFEKLKQGNAAAWKNFWTKGAAVDLSGSTDSRANELERRIILSQYLTKIQCGGSMPPQETGLTFNSWFGKPHLEMHWWHAVHFALWNRLNILEKQMRWYKHVYDKARQIAKRQGYEGVRWQKMTDPDGNESPSSIGAFLIWQQPHFITFAELCYRQHPVKKYIDQYKELVFATADFMASYAYYDSATHRYILGKGLIPAQERFKAEDTYNPTYELAYWRWALNTAQSWRIRSGMARNKKWDDVLDKLSALPVKDNLYLAAESAADSYTNPKYKTDHPAVLGTYGMLPWSAKLDTVIMKNTFNWVWKNWDWKDTWGWDFPLAAMTATRLNMPDKAIDALLMNIKTNTYLNNGHNYQDDRLRLYLPGNGGLLTAIAIMCAGFDGCKISNPGFPKDGKWKVRWEGLQRFF